MAVESGSNARVLGEATIQELRTSLQGEVFRPGDEGYDAARKVWNGMIDKHPALIVRCRGVADVINSIVFSRSEKLLVAVRGGGHNVAGNAVCDGGIVIDLSTMKSVRVDPVRCTARAEPGVVWGEFDRETQAFGLATTGGLVSTTGIAGFTLGGGIGWLLRKYGLTCDNLLSADVVMADGRFLTASATENSDLFWGLRGGGGNFGVVTSFEYRLHPVGPVLGGLILHPASRARDFLRHYRDVAPAMPDGLTTLVAFITAPPLPFIPTEYHGSPMVGVVVCYDGPIQDGEVAIGPLRAFSPPAAEHIAAMPYTVLQTLFDASAPAGMQNYWKSAYLSSLTDGAIDTIVAHAATMAPGLSAVHIHQLGGAMGRIGESDTAFAHRDAQFVLNVISMWEDPAESDRHIRWTQAFAHAMEPFASGVYVNFLGNEGDERVRSAYGVNYGRLVALKQTYDPTNFFRLNQNIKPTPTTP